jgi:hypothetical protein
VPFSVVLLEREIWVFREYLLDYRYNNTAIRGGIYYLLVLLPKQPLMPAIFARNRPPEHPPYLSLVPLFEAIVKK